MTCSLTGKAWREAADFIEANLPLTEVPGTGIRLHLAGPRSGMTRLVPAGGTPYWAHAWPGGVALATHMAADPSIVAGQVAYDVGAGSGLVAIAARKAGAHDAIALDADPLAQVAASVNARANGEAIGSLVGPPRCLGHRPAPTPNARTLLILAGDVFYDADTAAWMTAAFDALPRSIILDGDIGRRWLPRDRLEPLACYPVRDVGDPPDAEPREGWVYRWRRP